MYKNSTGALKLPRSFENVIQKFWGVNIQNDSPQSVLFHQVLRYNWSKIFVTTLHLNQAEVCWNNYFHTFSRALMVPLSPRTAFVLSFKVRELFVVLSMRTRLVK